MLSLEAWLELLFFTLPRVAFVLITMFLFFEFLDWSTFSYMDKDK